MTRRHIFTYTLLLSAATLTLFAPLHALGVAYLVAAVMLDSLFVYLAWTVLKKPTLLAAGTLFGYSIVYLTLLFIAMAADRLIA